LFQLKSTVCYSVIVHSCNFSQPLATSADLESLRLVARIAHLDRWKNRLKLNASKTQSIWLGIGQQLAKLTVSHPRLTYVSRRVPVDSVGSGRGSGQPAVHGVTSHRSLPIVLPSVAATACGTAVTHDRRSIIPCSGLHSLPSGLLQRSTHWDSQGQMKRLQAVQNAAAPLVSTTHRRNHSMSLLRNLHWLPVGQRVIFTTAVLVCKCIHGVDPVDPEVILLLGPL